MAEGRDFTIAILDDSPTVRQLVVDLLSAAGHQVQSCASWAELKEALSAREPDLVLLDVEMPDVVGDHIGYAIKRNHQRLRVVYLSDLDEPTLQAMCKRTGVDGYIRKSPDRDALLRAIVGHLPSGR